MRTDTSVHSDLLVHWTGKDIDQRHHPGWDSEHSSKTNETVTNLYLRRFNDILQFGLWLTEEAEQKFRVGTREIIIPPTPQCCFTELKLSGSRHHARRYGRLGIGVKRPFLFERFGRPLAYFGFGNDSNNDKFLETCARELIDPRLLNFFKPMNTSSRRLDYDLYSESEWRILYFDELLKQRKIIDPRDDSNAKEHAYFKGLPAEIQKKLRYLLPLDGWFALVIYPSLATKNAVQWSSVRSSIEVIKSRDDHGNRVEGLRNPIRGNWPIEVDLDACRHF
jgi:hypothetical protein